MPIVIQSRSFDEPDGSDGVWRQSHFKAYVVAKTEAKLTGRMDRLVNEAGEATTRGRAGAVVLPAFSARVFNHQRADFGTITGTTRSSTWANRRLSALFRNHLGWIFCRLDCVGENQPGSVVLLKDTGHSASYSRFDYFHSTIHTLINKGTPSISGVSRQVRVLVLLFNVMALSLYAVAIARILQLTKASL